MATEHAVDFPEGVRPVSEPHREGRLNWVDLNMQLSEPLQSSIILMSADTQYHRSKAQLV